MKRPSRGKAILTLTLPPHGHYLTLEQAQQLIAQAKRAGTVAAAKTRRRDWEAIDAAIRALDSELGRDANITQVRQRLGKLKLGGLTSPQLSARRKLYRTAIGKPSSD